MTGWLGGARGVAELVDQGDLDELLRRIDALCDAGNWEGLLDLRDRARAAFERGRQLWPAASHAEYRLALQAPGRWAASVVVPGAGRFALGPLSEVAASTHMWHELAPHLPPTPEAALVAQERVVRGEDLRADGRVDTGVVELPLVLQPWEPSYPLATYQPYKVELAEPFPLRGELVTVPAPGEHAHDPDSVQALVDLVSPWTSQSNGKVSAVAVEGDALDAVAALMPGPDVRWADVDLAAALATMAWAAASGGAHGRRRGMAQGRFAAWWALAALAGTLDRWPDLADAVTGLRWYRWDRVDPSTGWALRLAAERASDRRGWAIEATDTR
jgi:hypothetical protein